MLFFHFKWGFVFICGVYVAAVSKLVHLLASSVLKGDKGENAEDKVSFKMVF